MTDIEIRGAVVGDLARIAELHIEAFPDSVLAELGTEAVRRNYLWQMEGPHDLTAIVAVDDSGILGFLFGGVFRGSTIGFVKKERWFLAREVVRHPRILSRGIGWNRLLLAGRLLARRGGNTPQPEDPDAVPRRSMGVLAIAVDPRAQGRRVGRTLMEAATTSAAVQGFEAMHLTVHPSNEQALGFYRSLGWTELAEPDGTWVGRMTFALASD